MKDWVRISHSPTLTTATVTLQDGNLSVRWSVKCFPGTLKKGISEARSGAESALTELREAIEAAS